MNLFMCLHKEATSCPKLCDNFFFPLATLKLIQQYPIPSNYHILYFIYFLLWNLDFTCEIWFCIYLHKRWNKGIFFTLKFCHWNSSKHIVWQVYIWFIERFILQIIFHIILISSFFNLFSMENYARTNSWVAYLFRVPWKCFSWHPKGNRHKKLITWHYTQACSCFSSYYSLTSK
jgi:hypothetical protein